MNPEFTVVIPTYKRPDLLTKCLDALSRQQLPTGQFDIIVVDDGNDTTTAQAVTEFAQRTQRAGLPIRTQYLGQSQRKGPAAARNRGWQAATGQIIAFTDDDTLPEPTWLTAVLPLFQQGAQVVTGQVRVPLPDQPSYHDRTTAFLEAAEFVTANCFCRRTALEQVGGFEEAFAIAWREDSDLQFKFLQAGIPIVSCADAVIVHPLRQAAWYAPLRDERKNRYDALLYKRHPRLFRQRIPAYRGLVIQYYASVGSFLVGLGALLAGQAEVAMVSFVVWLLLEINLIFRRWPTGKLTWAALKQAVLLALATPFLSVYWRLYGAFTYKVLYI